MSDTAHLSIGVHGHVDGSKSTTYHALALYLRVKESGWSNDEGDNDGEDNVVGGALCRNDGG